MFSVPSEQLFADKWVNVVVDVWGGGLQLSNPGLDEDTWEEVRSMACGEAQRRR